MTATSGRSTATAHISFSRPGKLRANGKSLFNSKYDLIVNGPSLSVFNTGAWQPSKDAEMGLATVTGLAGTAPMTVSSLLLHTKWGSLEGPQFTVAEERLSGRDCYRLDRKGQMTLTAWIDKKTHFLVKTKFSVMRTTVVVDFGAPRINKPIPASRFVK